MMSLQKHTKQAVPNTWVLLDNASTIDVFINLQLVSNMWPVRITSTSYVQPEWCTWINP